MPVITVQFDRLELHLLFASLAFSYISRFQDLRGLKLLERLDEESALSLKGSRVSYKSVSSRRPSLKASGSIFSLFEFFFIY